MSLLNIPHRFEPSTWLPLRCKHCMATASDRRHLMSKSQSSQLCTEGPVEYRGQIWSEVYSFTPSDIIFLHIVESGVTYEQYIIDNWEA